MNDTLREFVLRKVRLRDDLKPVEIYMGDPPPPIEPDWVAITHGFSRRLDGCNLVFFRFDGTAITSEPFDTLEIALDRRTRLSALNIQSGSHAVLRSQMTMAGLLGRRSRVRPNHALQRTAAGRRSCNRRISWPPSLSLGR